ncbi:phosphotransferase [Streptomyces sp. G-G2]|uniref:phosphotransferase family protein n=1 Tax=Streptomyces sp. G-G2 TaxID=3046201 RepID=UPI0024B96894|nr:phosphotransferase [Streptomyces sp. G-G2]MDJ0381709.1 phosphotransferase [Streptomyces sp. G-G2]
MVLADREDGTVVRWGAAVAKAHAGDSDRGHLAARIRIAGSEALAGILLPPLDPGFGHLHGRPVSLWPYGVPVDPGRPAAAPWEETARLLARLHRVPVHRLPGPVPPMRGPAKVARALRRMSEALTAPAPADPAARTGDTSGPSPAVPGFAPAPAARAADPAGPGTYAHPEAAGLGQVVAAAADRVARWARGIGAAPPSTTLCHGDLHLGQLVRYPAPTGPWTLIDVDDLGLGDPAWDLARPAAWYAAGLLDPDVWLRFLDAYRAEGGPAAGPPGSDPWPELDLAARALTVQTAALALAKAVREERRLDAEEGLMLDACARIATLPADLPARGAP